MTYGQRRDALRLAHADPHRAWGDIARELGVPRRTLTGYLRAVLGPRPRGDRNAAISNAVARYWRIRKSAA